ncbi:low molecular weight protein-tyrosine-phosphatase [Wandonia haliotis]|uniref:protein-tyrosine-phosphatase n=1 Tax=Wandonia haliotis TaxID=574963 RepID=A0ABP3Y470_9FLAO
MTKILMVCLGNICRSPLADGILRSKVSREGLNVIVDSAGTSAHHTGEAPDARMRAVASERGFPLDTLRARQFSTADFSEFDVIFAMDDSNLRNILKLAKSEEDKRKVHLFLNELHPGSDRNVPDPYFGGQQGFIDVFTMVDQTTDRIIEKLKNGEY